MQEGDKEDGVRKTGTDFLFSSVGLPERERDAEVRFCAGSLVRSALRNNACKRLRKQDWAE